MQKLSTILSALARPPIFFTIWAVLLAVIVAGIAYEQHLIANDQSTVIVDTVAVVLERSMIVLLLLAVGCWAGMKTYLHLLRFEQLKAQREASLIALKSARRVTRPLARIIASCEQEYRAGHVLIGAKEAKDFLDADRMVSEVIDDLESTS